MRVELYVDLSEANVRITQDSMSSGVVNVSNSRTRVQTFEDHGETTRIENVVHGAIGYLSNNLLDGFLAFDDRRYNRGCV